VIGFIAFSLKRAWQGFWRNALMSIAATATMVLMLMLLAGFWILQTGLQGTLDYTESKVEVVADLEDNIDLEEVQPVIDRLESAGLVVRRPHPVDGRAVLAEITDAGRATVEAATADLVGADFALGALAPEQLRQISEVLRPVRQAAGDF